jgi:nucleotide-binding universal stress UspA family protein
MRIICGTDFTALAREAMSVAGLWSREAGGELHLIHAIGVRPQADIGVRERAQVAAEAERLRGDGVRPSAADAIAGDPEDVLVSEAGRRQADLLVLGAVGHRFTERWLLGSTAARVAERAKIPVLVVREAAPFKAWLRGERSLRVVTGFERGESAHHAVRWAARLHDIRPVDLTVLQLVLPGEENRRLESIGPGMGIALSQESERALLSELNQTLAPLTGSARLSCAVRAALGRRDMHLALAAEDLKADLLVVGSHQRRGFQRWWHASVSSGVLHAAAMSVAVIPFLPSPDSV